MIFKSIATLRSKIRRICEWWHTKSPAEKWDLIYAIGRKMCDLIGVRVLSDNRVNWYSACGGLSATLYVLLNIYTIQYYLRHDEFVRGMECMFMVGLVIGVRTETKYIDQLILRFLLCSIEILLIRFPFQNMLMYFESIGSRRFKYHAIINFCATYFYKTDTKSSRYKSLRAKHIDNLLEVVVSVFVLLLLGYGILLMGPIFESIYHHTRSTPLATNLPFFEKNSHREFIVNMVLQSILIFVSTCGNFASQMAACMVNHAIMVVPDLIQFNLLEFQDELIANGMNAMSRARLLNTFIQQQDYNR